MKGAAAASLAVVLLGVVPGALAQQPDGASQQAHAPSPFEREDVRRVGERIVCYCGCPHLEVSSCYCGTADAIRDEVAAALDSGMSEDEVIAAYVAEHGAWALAEPPREGFNLVIWILPVVLVVFGVVLLLAVGRRWTRPPEPAPATAMTDEDSPYRRRVEELVRRD